MLSFVAWHGGIPKEARRVSDIEAMQHPVTWNRRHLAKGAACDVIGFALYEHWWTLLFEHIDTLPGGAEIWGVEAYSNGALNWTSGFIYDPREDRWRAVLSHS
jgi:hypothetical protein